MIRTQAVEYSNVENTFAGTICWDKDISGPTPGVLVVPMFKGHTDFELIKRSG